MVDVVSRETRSRMMSGIRGKNTKPELLVRRELHRQGFRFRLHQKNLPGKPDLVLPKYKAVIFVHGCFWHGHNCHLFKWPKTRPDFWRNKINTNRDNDRKNIEALIENGWRVVVIWEFSLKGKMKLEPDDLISRVAAWIRSGPQLQEISSLN